MRVSFNDLSITNFVSFVGAHHLELSDRDPALNFVRGRNLVDKRLGSNGAGKSTLWNALAWCLYGRTTQGLLGPDVRPWSGDGQTVVEVALEVDDKERLVKRTAGPNSITVDGKPVLQPEIDRLLGMSFNVFQQTTLLGQGRPLFHDLPNSEKLGFLADVLDLERFERYSKKAARQADFMEEELRDFEAQYNADSAIAKTLETQIEQQEQEYQDWEAGRQSDLKVTEETVKALTKSHEAFDLRLAELRAQHDLTGTNLDLLEKDLAKFNKTLREAERELGERKVGASSLSRLRELAQEKLDDLLQRRTCPTCGQPIKDQKNYLANKRRIEAEIQKYLDDAAELDIEAVTKRLEDVKKKANFHEVARDEMKAALDKVEAEKNLFTRNRNDERVKLDIARAELERLTTSGNPHRKRLNDLKKSRALAVNRAAEAKKEIRTLEVRIERRRFWVKAFKDIRLFVLEDVLHELELVTNDMLDAVGLVNWEVGYAIERETKSGTIQKGLMTTVMAPGNNGENVKWAAWSGGEGQRIRLVGALALSEVLLARAGVECNIEVLDEPTRHLSTEGALDLCEFLSDRAERLGRTIWLVDHKAMESSYFDRVVTVTKGKAGSSLSLRNGGAQ